MALYLRAELEVSSAAEESLPSTSRSRLEVVSSTLLSYRAKLGLELQH
jgi:hypothetical protein